MDWESEVVDIGDYAQHLKVIGIFSTKKEVLTILILNLIQFPHCRQTVSLNQEVVSVPFDFSFLRSSELAVRFLSEEDLDLGRRQTLHRTVDSFTTGALRSRRLLQRNLIE